jgi:hypothetical protein
MTIRPGWALRGAGLGRHQHTDLRELRIRPSLGSVLGFGGAQEVTSLGISWHRVAADHYACRWWYLVQLVTAMRRLASEITERHARRVMSGVLDVVAPPFVVWIGAGRLEARPVADFDQEITDVNGV